MEETLYGVFNTEDGEWTGEWFTDEESAQEMADSLSDDPVYVVALVNLYEDGDPVWLCESSVVLPCL